MRPATLLLLLPAAALAQPPAAPSFVDQVKAHFARWDRDGNGTLSREEIDRAVADPAVKGPEAAAVVALRRAVRNTKTPLPPLTRDTILTLAAGGKDAPDLAGMYAAARTRIAAAKHELFARGGPTLDDVSQGRLGDCFCLAPLGAMVARNPADVAKMITPAPGGGFHVRFGHKVVTVPAPTDAELAILASSHGDGIWVNVYEKAVGKLRADEARAAGKEVAPDLDLLTKGGSAGTMVGVVTGKKIERFSCTFAHDPKIPSAEVAAKLAAMRTKLTAAFAAKKLVTCGTGKGVIVPGVNGNHAYAVLGYDRGTDHITLWNPHGQDFTPKGAPGKEHGYPTKDGRFRMLLPEFAAVFAGLAFETDESL
ncbi:MAG TPA: C2 family cysteine protease [Urbifossiella sp.]|jgi:hypothetical protein|nr:C2 family cysteine protease [Urbifossiella sp.]